jgi:hypothetical protein
MRVLEAARQISLVQPITLSLVPDVPHNGPVWLLLLQMSIANLWRSPAEFINGISLSGTERDTEMFHVGIKTLAVIREVPGSNLCLDTS